MGNQLGTIKHIVQLMLENRSFDQMLGFLYDGNKSPTGQPFEGLTGNESNPDDNGRDFKVYKIDRSSSHPYLMPGADPGEGYQHTNYQLFSTDDPVKGAVPTNKGFLIDFKAAIASDLAKGFKDTLPGTDPSEIMGCILHRCCRSCRASRKVLQSVITGSRRRRPRPCRTGVLRPQQRRWDSCRTAHAKFLTCPSIYGQMSKSNVDWAIYGYNSEPMTRMDFPDTRAAADSHYGHFRDFEERAADGTLPAYSFLEPDWGGAATASIPTTTWRKAKSSCTTSITRCATGRIGTIRC